MSKKQLSTWALDVEASSNNNKFVGCNGRDDRTQYSWYNRHAMRRLPKDATINAGTNSVSNEEFSNEKGKESSNQNITLPGKRKRQFRWQRQRKRRQLAGQGTSSLISCTESFNNNNNFSSGSRGQPGLGIASGLSNGQVVNIYTSFAFCLNWTFSPFTSNFVVPISLVSFAICQGWDKFMSQSPLCIHFWNLIAVGRFILCSFVKLTDFKENGCSKRFKFHQIQSFLYKVVYLTSCFRFDLTWLLAVLFFEFV